jgi:CubicO group peptidase (beta-lactamase class C family)
VLVDIHGFCDDRFAHVRNVFERNFEEHGDVGASFALTLEGEYLIDMWAGHRDAAATLPWEENTIVNVYSTTKTMTALSALLLADRGELDFGAKVASYWPEFAQNGKEDIEVRHLMSHSAGLSGLEEFDDPSDYYDWDLICTRLAAQAPWWTPGTQSGYHAITQGYLIGEVVRRVTGRSLGTFFREEIADPLEADFHIGVDPKHFPRIGELIPPEESPDTVEYPEDSVAARTFGRGMIDALASRTDAWRRAEIPAANGHGNARSVVRVQTLLANHGTAFGKALMTPEGCLRVMEEQTNGTDLVLGVPTRYGLGYGLNQNGAMGPNANTCYWGGWGGSAIVVDLDARLCFSYVMNRMDSGVLGDPRGFGLMEAVFDCLA